MPAVLSTIQAQPWLFLDLALIIWGMGHGQRSTLNTHLPPHLPPERVAAQKYKIGGSSKNWNFSNIPMNNKKPREALHALDVLLKEEKTGLHEMVMSRHEFSHWCPHCPCPYNGSVDKNICLHLLKTA